MAMNAQSLSHTAADCASGSNRPLTYHRRTVYLRSGNGRRLGAPTASFLQRASTSRYRRHCRSRDRERWLLSLEGRRPQHPHPQASQNRIREIAVETGQQRDYSSNSQLVGRPIGFSPVPASAISLLIRRPRKGLVHELKPRLCFRRTTTEAPLLQHRGRPTGARQPSRGCWTRSASPP